MKTSSLFLSNKFFFLGLLSLLTINVSGIVGKDSIAIHMLGHASLCFEYNDQIIHVDPYSSQANYSMQNFLLPMFCFSAHYETCRIAGLRPYPPLPKLEAGRNARKPTVPRYVLLPRVL